MDCISLCPRRGCLADASREILNHLKLKPSLDWLLIFVLLAILLRFWPRGSSPTALFVCSALGIIPVAGWIGRATEALAAASGKAWADCSTPLSEMPPS